ncbi:two-component system OmpR family response regulator [Azorhizobium sp. AG788]|uniref:response regulator n=1 Tax=Azorhizobium sp. AG788 TaxID=2183897 RepID=UPI001060C133|nr:response regulator [Azorhizobium sp. AG788]TDT96827.1 two-component system OmpR family response regulator [Azorhizobium sp. AG788]
MSQGASATTLLIVEDDREIRSLLADFLGREGYDTRLAADGRAMDAILAGIRPDLVILDIMLPGEDGLSLCRRLRAQGDVPVLMLTAKGDEVDRIVGLEVGADDYLVKPFNPRELLARIRAILRRAKTAARMGEDPRRQDIAFGGLIADLDARSVRTPDGIALDLTSAEFDLLACFLERPRRVLSRDQLLDWTRGRSADPFDRTIDVAVSRLRRRLSLVAPEAAQLIKTVRNGGYIFALPPGGKGN